LKKDFARFIRQSPESSGRKWALLAISATESGERKTAQKPKNHTKESDLRMSFLDFPMIGLKMNLANLGKRKVGSCKSKIRNRISVASLCGGTLIPVFGKFPQSPEVFLPKKHGTARTRTGEKISGHP
jgi:hypothetical protein